MCIMELDISKITLCKMTHIFEYVWQQAIEFEKMLIGEWVGSGMTRHSSSSYNFYFFDKINLFLSLREILNILRPNGSFCVSVKQ